MRFFDELPSVERNEKANQTYPLKDDYVLFRQFLVSQWMNHVFLDELLNAFHRHHITTESRMLLVSKPRSFPKHLTLVGEQRREPNCWECRAWPRTCIDSPSRSGISCRPGLWPAWTWRRSDPLLWEASVRWDTRFSDQVSPLLNVWPRVLVMGAKSWAAPSLCH